MASSTSTTILNAIRSGDLDTLEQTADEQLLELAQDDGHWLMEEAVKSTQWAAMWWLLHKAEQLDNTDLPRGWTRAHCAAAQGDFDLLRSATREELEETTDAGENSLHVAARGGQAGAIEFLVRERGLEHSATTVMALWTPLHVATIQGHVGAVEKLVELGADMDVVDVDSMSTLALAAVAGQAETMRCLLQLGCGTLPPGWGYDSVMHHAARSGNVETLRVLVQHGGFNVEDLGFFERRPLHCAAECGDAVTVKYLLALGAQVDTVDEDGWTALHYAVSFHQEKTASMVTDVLRVLLVAGADRSIKNRQGRTARDMQRSEVLQMDSAAELLDSYWPVTLSMLQLLLGLRGPTESPLTRFCTHALFEPALLPLVKCLITGQHNGAFTQLVQDTE